MEATGGTGDAEIVWYTTVVRRKKIGLLFARGDDGIGTSKPEHRIGAKAAAG